MYIYTFLAQDAQNYGILKLDVRYTYMYVEYINYDVIYLSSKNIQNYDISL